MKNNRDNFKPGDRKPFSRDSRDGGYNKNRSGGDFKRNDRSYGSNKSFNKPKTENSGKPSGFNKFGEKSNYSSNSSSYAKGSDRGYKKFIPGDRKPFSRDSRDGGGDNKNNNYKSGGDFKRNDRDNRENRDNRDNRDNRGYGANKSGGFNRSDKPNNFNKFGDKPSYPPKNDGGGYNKFKKFDNSDRGDRNDGFNKFNKFDKKPDRKFDKPFDKPYEKKFEKKSYKFERKPERPDRTERITEKNVPNVPDAIVSSVEQEDSGMVYGRNAVIELLKSGKSIDKLFVQSGQKEGSITMIFAEAVKKSIPIIEVEKAKLDSMINNSAHQGVIALASEKEYCSVEDILQVAEERGEKPFILIADKIMDPHNLGAIIRTAECVGVHGIVIPKRNAAGVSPIVTKTSAGASIHMAIAKVANIANTIGELKDKGVWVFASSSDISTDEQKEIKDYYEADYDIPLALVVGNEGEGLSPIVIQKSDYLVRIPMSGKIDSLNVSCASAVLMYEAARQRKSK